MPEPTVLVVRHPDYANSTYTDPDIRVITFDLGSSYDITNIHDEDQEALEEDIEVARELLGEYPDGPIATGLRYVLSILEEA